MTKYFFKGGNELLFIDVRSRTDIWLASSRTCYKLVNVSDKFYDGELDKHESVNMTDDQFRYKLVTTLTRQGYKFEGQK